MTVEKIVREFLEDALGRPLEKESDENQFVGDFVSAFSAPALPRPGETAAVSIWQPKTAALCYDRVWRPSFWVPPEGGSDIAFHGTTRWEIELACWIMLWNMFQKYQKDYPENRDFVEPMYGRSLERLCKLLDKTDVDDFLPRATCRFLGQEHHINAVPMFDSGLTKDRVYKPGDVETVTSLLSNVAVIDEAALSWAQVREFRQDSKSRAEFRRLTHWLDREMTGKPLPYIEDEIALRLDAYDRAMKKHGLKTIIGSLSTLVQADFLVAGAAVTSVAAAFSGGLAALIAGASLTIGKVSLHIANALLDAETTREAAAGEIAFVLETKKLSKQAEA